MDFDCVEARNKNEIDYAPIDRWSISKNVFVVLSFNTGGDRRLLWARIYILIYFLLLRRGLDTECVQSTQKVHLERRGCCDGLRQPTGRWRQFFSAQKKIKRIQSLQVDSRLYEATNELLGKRRVSKRDT